MRRLLLALLLLTLGATVLATCRRATPEIVLETRQLDLGDVANGVTVTRDITVSNQGDGPLQVDIISTSCGCTTAALEPMALAPGAHGTLHIQFDAGAHGPELTGPLVRQIFIHSNDPAQPAVTLDLTVNVTPPTSESN